MGKWNRPGSRRPRTRCDRETARIQKQERQRWEVTSQEISDSKEIYSEDYGFSQICWMKEIAYQLAVMNERRIIRENLGSPVNPDSSPEVRGSNRAVKVLRACAQTILENQMNPAAASDYLNSYADAVQANVAESIQLKPGDRIGVSIGIEGFEAQVFGNNAIHTYRPAHPDNRFCVKCGAGEFNAIHDIPKHMRGETPEMGKL